MSLFMTGTDTGVGKTIASAAVLRQHAPLVPGLRYWKPVQTGDDDDRATVEELSGLPADRFLPNTYHFPEPLSPHRAAELADGQVELDPLLADFERYSADGPLLIEGAGGLLVPLTRQLTWVDFLQRTKLPVLLATRTALGTINHSLLTAQALKAAGIPAVGYLFCGADNPDNLRTITEFSDLPALARFEYADGQGLPDDLDIDPAGLLRRVWPASR